MVVNLVPSVFSCYFSNESGAGVDIRFLEFSDTSDVYFFFSVESEFVGSCVHDYCWNS